MNSQRIISLNFQTHILFNETDFKQRNVKYVKNKLFSLKEFLLKYQNG